MIKIVADADGLSVEHATGSVVVPAALPADLGSALERGDSTCDGSPEARAVLDAARVARARGLSAAGAGAT